LIRERKRKIYVWLQGLLPLRWRNRAGMSMSAQILTKIYKALDWDFCDIVEHVKIESNPVANMCSATDESD